MWRSFFVLMQHGCYGNEMPEDTVPGSKTATRKETLKNHMKSESGLEEPEEIASDLLEIEPASTQ